MSGHCKRGELMKVLSLSYTDYIGGAAKAAYRIHNALRLSNSDVENTLLVRIKSTDDPAVKVFGGVHLNPFRIKIGGQIQKLQQTCNENLHTGNWLPSKLSNYINNSNADVVHLHWVAGEMLSIADLGKIDKPIVWTLHDMWPFCGSEHVDYNYDNEPRWVGGYTKINRSNNDRWIDVDKHVWNKKIKFWDKRNNFHIVGPSQWMSSCAKKSLLFRDSQISTIPNCLDMSVFKRLDKRFCREILSLPQRRKIILFGAIGGAKDKNKGFHFLVEAINKLYNRIVNKNEVLCVVFGQSKPEGCAEIPFDTIWTGHLYDDTSLSLLYNAADVMVVPSMVESFGQTASEAQACGCPVVSFRTTGLIDIIIDNETGFLVNKFDCVDMSEAIASVIFASEDKRRKLSNNAIARAAELWSYDVVSAQYISLYEQMSK